jgi:hypothetical protein
MGRPEPSEYGPAFGRYIDLVQDENIHRALEGQFEEMISFLKTIHELEGNQRHAPYTWSVKEVVGHIADTERIFGTRALRFARADQTPLPGFDENDYARAAEFDHCKLSDLVAELESLRLSHIWMFRNLTGEAWLRTGVASQTTLSVRALAYAIVGHTKHHFDILRRRLAGIA